MKFRKAVKEDVPAIVQMLANDKIGQTREDYSEPLPDKYFHAFDRINNDPNQELIVMEARSGEIAGTLQLSFIPYLTYQGGIRAQIEGVRVREDLRGKGLGQTLFQWAMQRAKERKAHILQLTADKERPEAIRFYRALGFKASHEGMKIHI